MQDKRWSFDEGSIGLPSIQNLDRFPSRRDTISLHFLKHDGSRIFSVGIPARATSSKTAPIHLVHNVACTVGILEPCGVNGTTAWSLTGNGVRLGSVRSDRGDGSSSCYAMGTV